MGSQYTYLLINLGVISVPVVFSFEQQVAYVRHWIPVLLATMLSAVGFIAWDVWFTQIGVWSFNAQYVTGIGWFGLPVEEILFFVCIPFACLFLYLLVKRYASIRVSDRHVRTLFGALSLLLAIVAVRNPQQLYTLVSCGLLSVLLACLAWRAYPHNGAMVITYVVHLLPFGMVNGLLTALPVVIYHPQHNSGLRAGTIPAEDFAYTALLLIVNVVLYEWIRKFMMRPAAEG